MVGTELQDSNDANNTNYSNDSSDSSSRINCYFLTYRHVNGSVISKQLTELELYEVFKSPFVNEVLAVTLIDFDNYQESLEKHKLAVKARLTRS